MKAGATLGSRLAQAAALVVALVVWPVWPVSPAWAHGVGGRTDLPVPAWQVAWAAACVIGISFVAVGRLWQRPHLRSASAGTALPRWAQRLSGALSPVARGLGIAALGVVVVAAAWGNVNPSVNIAPAAFYIAFWVAVPALSCLIGDMWAAFNPMIPLSAGAAGLRRRVKPAKPHSSAPEPAPTQESNGSSTPQPDSSIPPGPPARDFEPSRAVRHHWWALIPVAGFAWLELAYHDPGSPRAIAVFVVAYVVAILAAAVARGRRWAAGADGFGVLFGLIGSMGVLRRDRAGNLRARWPVAGLASLRVLPGTAALIVTVLGATSFDGFTRGSMWLDVTSGRSGWGLTAFSTLGLGLAVGAVFVIYRGAVAVMAMLTHDPEHELADLFAPSLIPISVAYIVAHYFSYLVFEGQMLLAQVSDPFGQGWNLFGTATRTVDYTVMSTSSIAWVQTATIVAGHILAVIVAHDRAVARYSHRLAVRSQYPMLAAMVAFTVIGLLLLLGA